MIDVLEFLKLLNISLELFNFEKIKVKLMRFNKFLKRYKNIINKFFKFLLFFFIPSLNSKKWSKLSKNDLINQYQSDRYSPDPFNDLIHDSLKKIEFKNLIEFGCHKGQRLFSLSNKYPNNKFIGYELNQSAVDLGNKYKKNNKIQNVTLFQHDITKKLNMEMSTHVVLSCATLIYISPLAIKKVIKNMIGLKPNHLVLIEVPLQPHDSIIKGLARKFKGFPNWSHNFKKLLLTHNYVIVSDEIVDAKVWSPGGSIGHALIFKSNRAVS